MGRININFHVTIASTLIKLQGFKPDVIPGRDLAMILLNLPGNTHITGVVTNTQAPGNMSIVNTIEAENDSLPDGTTVICKYMRQVTSINGVLSQFDCYDGMEIMQPKSPPPPQSSGFGNYSNVPYGVAGNPSAGQGGKTTHGSGSLGPCMSGHNWVTYNSGISVYDYCSSCGVKK